MKVHWHHYHTYNWPTYSNTSNRLANLNGSQQTVHWTSFVYQPPKSAVSLYESYQQTYARPASLQWYVWWNYVISAMPARMTHLFPVNITNLTTAALCWCAAIIPTQSVFLSMFASRECQIFSSCVLAKKILWRKNLERV